MSGSESASEWIYDAGVYRFGTETVAVEMDEATFADTRKRILSNMVLIPERKLNCWRM